jgi:hypothetical protein
MKNELKTPKPYIRRLSVSYLFDKKRLPFIRLCGKWLEDAGFFPSDQILVKVEKQKLVIEMMEEKD